MTKNRKQKIESEDVSQIIKDAYLQKGYQIPQYYVSIAGNEVSISIDSETPYIEFKPFMDVIGEIVEKMKESNFIKCNGYFFYSYYIMDFNYSK